MRQKLFIVFILNVNNFLLNGLLFILQLVLEFYCLKCHTGTMTVKGRRSCSWRENREPEGRRKGMIYFLS